MNRRLIRFAPLLTILFCTFTPRASDAQMVVPVSVTIVGHWAIRFRLAEGTTAPCDSSRNRVTYEGWLEPGVYAFPTTSRSVCYEHTSGAFREVNWSTGTIVSTLVGRRRYVRPVEIVIETD
jgi:hypothetical protein